MYTVSLFDVDSSSVNEVGGKGGCGNATQLLQDGQEVLVDGDNGLVTMLTT